MLLYYGEPTPFFLACQYGLREVVEIHLRNGFASTNVATHSEGDRSLFWRTQWDRYNPPRARYKPGSDNGGADRSYGMNKDALELLMSRAIFIELTPNLMAMTKAEDSGVILQTVIASNSPGTITESVVGAATDN